jgi:hypothetical protein
MDLKLTESTPQDAPPPAATFECPKCHFVQPEGGKDCVRCGVVFARYKASSEPAAPPPMRQPEMTKEQAAIEKMKAIALPPSGPGLFSQLFRLARWTIVLGCLVALFMMFKQAPPPIVAMDPEGAKKAGDKFLAAQEAVTQGQPFTMPLTEAELNAWLQSNLASSGGAQAGAGGPPTQEQVQSSMKDIKLHLVGDQVQAYTLFTLYGRDVTLQLKGKLQVKDGRIRLDATEGMLGTLPIPKATLGSVTSSLFDSPTNREKFVLPPHIANVQVQNGELLISYKGTAPL